jgi:ribosomal protein S18 acetylase RimI-like enzyme
MLYVDGENGAAIRLYSSLGFTHIATDVMYEHAAPGPSRQTSARARELATL